MVYPTLLRQYPRRAFGFVVIVEENEHPYLKEIIPSRIVDFSVRLEVLHHQAMPSGSTL